MRHHQYAHRSFSQPALLILASLVRGRKTQLRCARPSSRRRDGTSSLAPCIASWPPWSSVAGLKDSRLRSHCGSIASRPSVTSPSRTQTWAVTGSTSGTEGVLAGFEERRSLCAWFSGYNKSMIFYYFGDKLGLYICLLGPPAKLTTLSSRSA
jgi:hypothetical protein